MSDKPCDFHIQTERPIHEGTINYVMCFSHSGSFTGPRSSCPTLRTYEGETMFFGAGSPQAAKKALRLVKESEGAA